MKKFKILIVIFIIIIIILCIVLKLVNKKENMSFNKNNNISNPDQSVTEGSSFNANEFINNNPIKDEERQLSDYKRVNNEEKYYIVESLIQYYIYTVANNQNQETCNILSKTYKETKNINQNNVRKFVTDGLEKDSIFSVKDMFLIEGEKIQTYSVYGEIWNSDGNKIIKEEYYIVDIDIQNDTFCIEPCIDKKYNSITDIKLSKKTENIEINENNIFYYKKLTTEEKAKKYYKNFIKYMLYYPEKAYELLDSDYRIKRFGNVNNFKSYIEENNYYIFRGILKKYTKANFNNSYLYTVTDNYDNYYKFEVDLPMKYNVFLDDYTIMKSSDLATYTLLSEYEKAKQQLVNFIKKVNTKDYQAIYTNLDDTFKKSNFQTMDKLKEFIKNNFYTMNTVEITENDDSVKEYSVFNCKITNMENKNESKNITVIIDIKENTDYTMSFSFN